ncbi:MAG: cytochrome c biogenesis protein CcsA [Bacteroidota bacterium]
MNWIDFPVYSAITIGLWLLGLIMVVFSKSNTKIKRIGEGSVVLGILVMVTFLVQLWVHLERPPMRTLGETRLWYSLFLPFIGIITYYRWHFKWFLAYSLGMAVLFLFINLSNPETYDKTLMPALRSPWFVPHVIVYIFAYAVLAASMLVAVYGLYQIYYSTLQDKIIKLADNLVYIGFAFLTFGLLFGALWAKEAWGHYWTWDPKETWAFLTWLMYLIYIHFRYRHPKKMKIAMWTLGLSFIILLIAWFGVNYLPAAQNSVHVYS